VRESQDVELPKLNAAMLDEPRLERLASEYLDQQLDPPGRHELEEMLRSSSRARRIFLDLAECHALTREWALQESAEAWSAAEPPQPKRRWWLIAAGGLAAGLAAGIFLVPRSRHRDPLTAAQHPPILATDRREDVALLAQAVDVEWVDHVEIASGSALEKGTLRISRGTLQLDFYSGARVFLEGPASFEILSKDLARLDFGRLTASVPPPAQGFTILNSDLRVVDRGTEFGMHADPQSGCEVHVFDGEVEIHDADPAVGERSLLEGRAVAIQQGTWREMRADRGSFADPGSFRIAAEREHESRLEAWRARSARFRETPGLLVFYDFEESAGRRQLPNLASEAAPDTDGTIIGCEATTGRWARKSAVGFARTSDRIRFRTVGESASLTMLARVRVDSLPLDHNALLSMSPSEVGEIHWKFDRGGRLLVGLRAVAEQSFQAWERLESPRIITEQDFGRWLHLATVIDGESGSMQHYVDGELVASAAMIRRPLIRLGLANIGNFDSNPAMGDTTPVVRSFNGRIDQFALVARAMDAEEIRNAP
jgi:hypothetical protein